MVSTPARPNECGEDLLLAPDGLAGEVLGEQAERLVGGGEDGEARRAVGHERHRGVGLGPDDGERRLGEDVEVALVLVEGVAVRGQQAGEAVLARRLGVGAGAVA